MSELICSFCKTPAVSNAIFCYQCGQQLKCKSCQAVLVEGANHCISCGVPLADGSPNSRVILNSIRFKENKDERSYELEFTNDVGKEIKEVVVDLLKNKLGHSDGQTLAIQNLKEEQISFSEAVISPQAQSGQKDGLLNAAKNFREEYPHLDDLEINLHCRENEWLLIFAFYTSDFGAAFFSKNAVWDMYKQKRKTETRFKNLGTNWKSLFKKYISTVRENEFKFTPLGLTKVQQLLKGQEQEKRTAKIKKRKVSSPEVLITNYRSAAPAITRKVVANSIMQEEFDAYKNSYKE